jgi:tRNA A-37 threonylcarbamoyl transferase component Bud32
VHDAVAASRAAPYIGRVDQEALRRALAGRYDIGDAIGEGASAVVFLAHETASGREVALKVLRPELAASIGHARFLKEVEIAARLTHPHIVPVLSSGVEGGFVYYAMPHVAGGSLRALLHHAGFLTLRHAAAITTQIADAIGYAHLQGVLHRDLKPENVLVAGAHAYVVDFGIAKALTAASGETLTRTGFAVGTPGYMSPEQAAGVKDLDERTDVYGLGSVVYEMLVGETPGVWVTDSTLRVGRFRDAAPAHRARLDALPGRVEQVLTRALALKASDRWPTVEAFAAAVAGACEGPPARYTAAEVRDIVGRAAQLEAQRPDAEPLYSVGTVERIAAEVDIPLEDVRRAMDELGYGPPPERPAPVPALAAAEPVRIVSTTGPAVEVDRVAEGEIRPEAFDTVTATLQKALGPGRATVFDGQLTWRSDGTPDSSARTIEVIVTSRGGKTRLRLTEWRWRLPGRFLIGALGAVGGGIVGAITGNLLGVLTGSGSGFAMLFFMGGVGAGIAVAQRALRVTDTDNETTRLNTLADQLLGPASPSAEADPEAGGVIPHSASEEKMRPGSG